MENIFFRKLERLFWKKRKYNNVPIADLDILFKLKEELN